MKKLIVFLLSLVCVFGLVSCNKKDEGAVESLVTDFITLKEQDFQSETHLSMEQYFVPEVRDSLETQLFWKVFRFEKLVRLQQNLLWETFNFAIQDIQIQGSTATVVAFEVYEYEIEEADGMSSGRGTTLYFTCEKVGDEWLIQSIETDNQLIENHVDGYSAEELPALAGYSE